MCVTEGAEWKERGGLDGSGWWAKAGQLTVDPDSRLDHMSIRQTSHALCLEIRCFSGALGRRFKRLFKNRSLL